MQAFAVLGKRARKSEGGLRTDCVDCPVLKNAVFRRLSTDQAARFNCIFRPARYHKNQIIFFEGGEAEHLFALTAGLVKMVKSLENGRERIMRVLFPGEMFGLEALNETTYPLTAVVLQDSEICSVPCKQFFAFLQENPDISLDMIRFLLSEIEQMRTQVTAMSFKDARGRVAMFVLSLLSPEQKVAAPSFSLTLPLTSHEIGEILELSPETVSRAWNFLRREGLIEKRGRHLVIRDIQGLEGTARH
jgi:CRP-like cAMP-binding protein